MTSFSFNLKMPAVDLSRLLRKIDPDSAIAWICWAAVIGMLIGMSL